MTELKFKVFEAVGIRDAKPEEIIAWCLLRCIDERDKLCSDKSSHPNGGCDGCPIESLGDCISIDEDACLWEIEDKNIILEVVE